jgi:hypothetical protein
MLQWNSKHTALLLVVLLIALAAFCGLFGYDDSILPNFTW